MSLPRKLGLVMPLLLAALIAPASGVSAEAKAARPAGTPSDSKAEPFAIESEMLTYGALHDVGASIAEDIANSMGTQSEPPGIVIIPSDSPMLQNLAIWRADMAVISHLRDRGRDIDCEHQGGAPPAAGTGKGKSPIDPLALASTATSLLHTIIATTEESSSVRGDVEEQVFASTVARNLKAKGIPVLMPDTYAPYSHAVGSGQEYSIFLELTALDNLRACLIGKLQSLRSEQTADSAERAWTYIDVATAQTLLSDIELFMSDEFGLRASAGMPPGQPANVPSAKSDKPAQNSVVTSESPHIAALLRADLFAKKLNTDASAPKRSHWKHFLWLKAAESGGTVTRTESFLRTGTTYSGGFIGTYALFDLTGELECSGTVGAYRGPLGGADVMATSGNSTLRTPAVLDSDCSSHQPPPPPATTAQ